MEQSNAYSVGARVLIQPVTPRDDTDWLAGLEAVVTDGSAFVNFKKPASSGWVFVQLLAEHPTNPRLCRDWYVPAKRLSSLAEV